MQKVRSARPEDTVGGACAASSHRCHRRPEGKREIGRLATAHYLEERELLLASSRRRGWRPVRGQQVKTDRTCQRRPDLCDHWRPRSPIGKPELHHRTLCAARAHELPNPPHCQYCALLTLFQVPARCEHRDGSWAGGEVDEPSSGLLIQLRGQRMGNWRRRAVAAREWGAATGLEEARRPLPGPRPRHPPCP